VVAITVGVPVFRGQEFIAETMNSILGQTSRDFTILISIDGGDDTSAAACEPFLTDPRVQLVQQGERLGWAGNLNWLMSQCDTEFFCYWQQDDLARQNYLETLLAAANAHPNAACTYCDVQWFGANTRLIGLPSVVGDPSARMLTLMRSSASWVPFRGVIRLAAIKSAGPIRTNHRMSSLEDLVWMVRLGRAGELLHVPDTLYLKRSHEEQLHRKWANWSLQEKREAWIHHGIGLLETIVPAGADRPDLVSAVVDRLVSKKRWRLYDVKDRHFVSDFLAAAKHDGLPSVMEAPASMRSKISEWLRSRAGSSQ
jgi:GT2 family glycosyltransferase